MYPLRCIHALIFYMVSLRTQVIITQTLTILNVSQTTVANEASIQKNSQFETLEG